MAKVQDLPLVETGENLNDYQFVVGKTGKDARVPYAKIKSEVLAGQVTDEFIGTETIHWRRQPKLGNPLIKENLASVKTVGLVSTTVPNNALKIEDVTGKLYVLPQSAPPQAAATGIEYAAQITFSPTADVTSANLLSAFKRTPSETLNGLRIGIFKSTLSATALATTAISQAGIVRSVTTEFVNHGTMLLFDYTNDVVTAIYRLKDDVDIFNRIDSVENQFDTNIIPLWVANTLYKVGKVVRHTDNKIYVVKTQHNTATFDATKFDALSVETPSTNNTTTTVIHLDSRVTLQETILSPNAPLEHRTPYQYGSNLLGYAAIPLQYDGWKIVNISVTFSSPANKAHTIEIRKCQLNNNSLNAPVDQIVTTLSVPVGVLGVSEAKSQITANKDFYLYVTGGTADVFDQLAGEYSAFGAVLTIELENPAAAPYLPTQNQSGGATIYEAANPSGQKMVTAIVKAVATTATVEANITAHGKKAVLFSLPVAAAGIEFVEMYFDDVQSAKDLDNSLYIAVKVAVPSLQESNHGRKCYPELQSVKSAATLLAPASPTGSNTYDYLHDGQVQRSIYSEPSVGNDYVVYRLLGMGDYDTAIVSFGRFM